MRQDYIISKEGKQLLLITALDVFTDSSEKIKPTAEFSSGDLNYGVFVLKRKDKYFAQGEKGSLLIDKKRYYINEQELEIIINIVKSWDEKNEEFNLHDINSEEDYIISLDSSKFLIDTTIGDLKSYTIRLEISKANKFFYVNAMIQDYGSHFTKQYIIKEKEFDEFKRYLDKVKNSYNNIEHN